MAGGEAGRGELRAGGSIGRRGRLRWGRDNAWEGRPPDGIRIGPCPPPPSPHPPSGLGSLQQACLLQTKLSGPIRGGESRAQKWTKPKRGFDVKVVFICGVRRTMEQMVRGQVGGIYSKNMEPQLRPDTGTPDRAEASLLKHSHMTPWGKPWEAVDGGAGGPRCTDMEGVRGCPAHTGQSRVTH